MNSAFYGDVSDVLEDVSDYMLASFKADNMCRGTGILVSDTPTGKFAVHSEHITPPQWPFCKRSSSDGLLKSD